MEHLSRIIYDSDYYYSYITKYFYINKKGNIKISDSEDETLQKETETFITNFSVSDYKQLLVQ